jgi:hypothetical protein
VIAKNRQSTQKQRGLAEVEHGTISSKWLSSGPSCRRVSLPSKEANVIFGDVITTIAGLSILRDYANPKQFYFLPPETPQLARTPGGDYALRLVVFRKDLEPARPSRGCPTAAAS